MYSYGSKYEQRTNKTTHLLPLSESVKPIGILLAAS
jgi:hypothetical protein